MAVLAFKRIQGLKIFSKRKREERTTSGSGALRGALARKGARNFSGGRPLSFDYISQLALAVLGQIICWGSALRSASKEKLVIPLDKPSGLFYSKSVSSSK